jgi:ribosomal protein S18 acetylase RimI-like enzyme
MGEDLKKIEAVIAPEIGGLIKIQNRSTGELIAHAEIMRRNQPGRKEILIKKFEVEPAYKNLGYGKMLMDGIKAILKTEARTGVLSVHASNSDAQGFYESQGWEFEDDAENEMPNRGQKADNLQRWMVYETD